MKEEQGACLPLMSGLWETTGRVWWFAYKKIIEKIFTLMYDMHVRSMAAVSRVVLSKYYYYLDNWYTSN